MKIKINDDNIHLWIMGVIILFLILNPILFGVNDFTMIMCGLGIAFLIIAVFGFLCLFLQACADGEIRFDYEIDLLKPFKTRHIKPEDEDKQNK